MVQSSTAEKFNWAQQHFERMLGEVDAFFKPKPYRIRSESNADSTEYRVYLDLTQPLPSARWGLIFGDGIHCLRSALDHCVYLIAVKESGTDPPPAERSLQFPITENVNKWAGPKGRSRHSASPPKQPSRLCNRTGVRRSSLCAPSADFKSSTTPTSTGPFMSSGVFPVLAHKPRSPG